VKKAHNLGCVLLFFFRMELGLRMRILMLMLLAGLLGCRHSKEGEDKAIKPHSLFIKLLPEQTGIQFINELTINEDFDVFRYRNYYNGGGVAIGDINNDGLPDVYLTSNMNGNRLYLNKGQLKFEDITGRAGVRGTHAWSTGVSMADLNADGLLDIYVCNSGDIKGNNRENELFINQGNSTFKEQAKDLGLNDNGFSTHAVFFDYDRDEDLDCYVLNNSFRPISTLGYRNLRNERDENGGDKLFKNIDGKFIDVSESAGIYGSVIGFGLGVTVGDVNNDNWLDLYISNDFYERDYLYINNHDGTFSEKIEDYMGHLSMFSMGADMADLNNDGLPEIFSTDMLPRDDYRLKTLSSFEGYDVYQLRLQNGYYHQFMRNMLQVNTGQNEFVELGFMAGVADTDWSWGALMADFDNDGYREIFVSNGIYKDVTEQDFIDFMGSDEQIKAAMEGKKIDFQQFVDRMTSTKLSNCMFKRSSDWQYKEVAGEWGLAEPSFSNGAAYGDLDNDGDLDLIVNNVNQPLFVYENTLDPSKNNFTKIKFKGPKKNQFGLGATVFAYLSNQIITTSQMPIRGFQSSMDYVITMGLGSATKIDSLLIRWPDDKEEKLIGTMAGITIVADYAKAESPKVKNTPKHTTWLKESTTSEIAHQENQYNDFDHERLIYHMRSTSGPGFAKGDLNNDGLDDLFLGGSAGKTSLIYLQKPNGDFIELKQKVFEADSLTEDVAAVFFDADGDKDLDLYVVTGGVENSLQSIESLDRLYINNSLKSNQPHFVKSTDLPALYQSGSCARPTDIDNDGDLDLFIGNRTIPTYYGLPCDQSILINDGKGKYENATYQWAPQLRRLGIVTDAAWFDYDGNGFDDLLIVGEWMPIILFLNDGKKLTKAENITGLQQSQGWWNTIKPWDADGDGDQDFVVGNLGLNSRFKPTATEPVNLYIGDFDQNGSLDPIFTYFNNGVEYPAALRQDLIKQIPSLKKKFVYHKDYAAKKLVEIFDEKQLANATKLSFQYPQTSFLQNNGKDGFSLIPLPMEAQVSPVYAIESIDLNNDKREEIVIAGNLFAVKPEIGRYDALHGLVLTFNGKFESVSPTISGIDIKGEVRHLHKLKTAKGDKLVFVRNNDSVKLYERK
jgi:enediyne biosynthesis protein E4